MPRYLTISDDLQITASHPCIFRSKSGKVLAAVVSDVETWVESNPAHPRVNEAESWLQRSADKIDGEITAAREKRLAAKRDLEDNIRWFVRVVGRRQKWTPKKIKEETNLRLKRESLI